MDGNIKYDAIGDILYISATEDLVSVVSKEVAPGVIVRNDMTTGELTSIILVDFKAKFKHLFGDKT